MAETLIIDRSAIPTTGDTIGLPGQTFTIPNGTTQNAITRIEVYSTQGYVPNTIVLALYRGGGSTLGNPYTFPIAQRVSITGITLVGSGYQSWVIPNVIANPLEKFSFRLESASGTASGVGIFYKVSGAINDPDGEIIIDGNTGVSQGHPSYVTTGIYNITTYELIYKVYMDTVVPNTKLNTIIIN